jgi:outer membrane protein TolC
MSRRWLPFAATGALPLVLVGCATVGHERPVPPSPSRAAELVPPTPEPRPAPVGVPEELLREGATVTLAQIIDIALQNNPATQASYLRSRAAAAAAGAKLAPYYPSVDLTANAARASLSTSQSDGVPLTNYGATLDLNWLLLDLGGRAADAEEARLGLLVADWTHDATIRDVVLRVQQTFVLYLNSKAQVEASTSNVRQAETALSSATVRHDAGVATIADVLQARTALSQARLTLESARGQVMVLRGALATAMGLPATTPYDVGTLPADLPLERVDQAVEELIAAALERRPELAAVRLDAERATVHIRSVRSEGLPTLSLGASAGPVWYDVGDLTARDNWSAGLLLSWPLFTGFENRYNLEQAREQAELARTRIAELEQQVVLQVWTSYYALETATQLVRTSRDLLASAEQSERVALGRYREGVGTIIDLLAAQSYLANARAQEIQARSGWFLALAQLARDTGNAGLVDQTIVIRKEGTTP